MIVFSTFSFAGVWLLSVWSGLWVGSGFAEDQWVKQVQPLIESSCLACHSDAEGIWAKSFDARAVIFQIRLYLKNGSMFSIVCKMAKCLRRRKLGQRLPF